MQRLKQQLIEAQSLYAKNREICLKRREQVLEICERIKNETYMWAGPKQLLEEAQKSCEVQEIDEEKVVSLMKTNQRMINALQRYNSEYSRQFNREILE